MLVERLLEKDEAHDERGGEVTFEAAGLDANELSFNPFTESNYGFSGNVFLQQMFFYTFHRLF